MAKRNSIRYLTDDEKKRFLRTLKDSKKGWRDYFLFSLMLSTGMRLTETVNLNVKDVFNGYNANDKLVVNGKGDRIREIPLNKAIKHHIEGYLKRFKRHYKGFSFDTPLFISRNNRRITPRAVQLNFDNWIKASGIEGKYSPHSLRHTVGTDLMKKTRNIRWVQEFLGHKFISTTQIYIGVTKEDMRECAELLAL